jgi:heptosyltransferase-2
MNILIRLPNWLGDGIMAIPAIYQLKESYPDAKFTIVGSNISSQLLFWDKSIIKVVDRTKDRGIRLFNLYRLAKELGEFDLAITFTNSFLSALFLYMTNSKIRVGFNKEFGGFLLTNSPKIPYIHHTKKYLYLIQDYITQKEFVKPSIDISKNYSYDIIIAAGAKYGEAKQWSANSFAQVINILSKDYKVAIVGANSDIPITKAIKKSLTTNNYIDLTAKTTLKELFGIVAGAKLLITNDSGTMHIGSLLDTPTIAIFGPTDVNETSAWSNKSLIIKKDIDCSPCKKRKCPKKTNECMNMVSVEDVINGVKEFGL